MLTCRHLTWFFTIHQIRIANEAFMWFKNLCIVQLAEPFKYSAEELETQLATHAAHPCSALQEFSYGWTPPLGREHNMLVHAAGGYYLLAARKETKVLPASVVREHLENKIAEIALMFNRKVGKSEKAKLKDEVLMELLPRAFHKAQTTYGYIDIRQKLLVIDTASMKRADEFLELLRKCLGSLDVIWPEVNEAPTTLMSNWLLSKTAPEKFNFADQGELVDRKGDGATVRFTQHDMIADEITHHIQANKQVKQLAMTWQDTLSFVLNDKLFIKRLRFLDLLKAEADDIQAESALERLDADFAIMTSAISELLPAIFHVFGGLKTEALTTAA